MPGRAEVASPAQAQAAADQASELAAQEADERVELASVTADRQRLARRRAPDWLAFAIDARATVRQEIFARALAEALDSRQTALVSDIARCEAQRRTLAAQATETFLLAPVEGPILVSFGGVAADGQRSKGLEIAAAAGAPVLSPAAGVVDYAGNPAGDGEVVILRTASGDHLVVSGLGESTVTRGQALIGGAQIGDMPKGPAAHPRLYVERLRGRELRAVDPAPFIARRDAGAQATGAK